MTTNTNKDIVQAKIKEFEEEISIYGSLRYSTRVEPRLCDAEKTKVWLTTALSQVQSEIIEEIDNEYQRK